MRGELVQQYRKHFGDGAAPLFRGLTEAMTNSVQHAYRSDEPNKPWWVFSEARQRRLIVAICDLGIGIPASLRSKAHWTQDLVDSLKESFFGDGQAIQGAMAIGRTRTGKSNRGRGLNQIRRVVDAAAGRLQIHSNRGSYWYDARSDEVQHLNFGADGAVVGTVILWSIPFKKGDT